LGKSNSSLRSRWTALDIVRGLTIALMILVNHPGDWGNLYAPLAHAEWHGATPTDFIFPFFLFIVGVSIVLAFSRVLAKGSAPKSLYPKIAKRTFLLFLFGVGMGLMIHLLFGPDFRWVGVLQRIAVVYLVCSILFLNTSWKTQLITCVVLLVGYWLFLGFVPVPGTGSKGFAWEDNWVSWFDRQYLPGALYQKVHDPEGLLSTLPAIGTGISGMLAGHLYLFLNDHQKLLRYFAGVGLGLVALGLLWDLHFPFNKNLWSSSYVVYTSGWAMLFLAGVTWLVDIKGWKWGVRPCLVFGANAITVYLLAFVLTFPFALPLFGAEQSIQGWVLGELRNLPLNPKQVSLLWAVLYLAICYIPMDILYRKRIFFKV